jgi:quinol monooxygenase YgiN
MYSLAASEGQEIALEQALGALATELQSIDGFDQLVVGRDRADPTAWTVLELWQSAGNHKASSSAIPKSRFTAIMDTLSRPPEMKDLDRLL